MKQETKELILSLSKEFDEKEGFVTCEFTTHIDKVDKLKKFIKENVHMELGEWVFYRCDTCVEEHGEGSIHAEIMGIDETNYKRQFKDVII